MFAGEICFLERFLIMKKFTILLIAALTLFVACGEKTPLGTFANYSISGEVSDADGDMQRLTASSIVVRLTDGKGLLYAVGVLIPTEEDRRFCFTGVPAGKYSLELFSEFYEDLTCPVIVEKDVVQDITLTPARDFTVDQTSLDFPPRVTARPLTITNTSDKDLYVSIKPKGNFTRLDKIEDAPYSEAPYSDSSWHVSLAPGESKQVTVKINRREVGKETGLLEISAWAGQHRTFVQIPMSVVTDEQDFIPIVRGRVTDKQGAPLQGVLLVCENRTTLSDEDGRYVFEGSFESGTTVHVTAVSEFYNYYQASNSLNAGPADIETEIDFALEPCSNHLTLDRAEIDFGTGSISGTSGTETIRISLTAEKDEPIFYRLWQLFPEILGFSYSPTSATMEKTGKLEFTLWREASKEGSYQLTTILLTETAGSYVIPVSFVNVP